MDHGTTAPGRITVGFALGSADGSSSGRFPAAGTMPRVPPSGSTGRPPGRLQASGPPQGFVGFSWIGKACAALLITDRLGESPAFFWPRKKVRKVDNATSQPPASCRYVPRRFGTSLAGPRLLFAIQTPRRPGNLDERPHCLTFSHWVMDEEVSCKTLCFFCFAAGRY